MLNWSGISELYAGHNNKSGILTTFTLLNSTSYRHGLPVSRTHGCDLSLAIPGFWIPAIPAGTTYWTLSLKLIDVKQ